MAAYWAVRRGQVEVANQPADAASLAEMPPVAQLVRAAAASFEASL
jgi:hypothetical protein